MRFDVTLFFDICIIIRLVRQQVLENVEDEREMICMLITSVVFILIAVIIGIAAWKNFSQTEILVDKKDRSNLDHLYKLKEAVNIEAAQELHPHEEIIKSNSVIMPDPKRNHIKAVPFKKEEKVKPPVHALPHKAEEKLKSTIHAVPHYPVQATLHKVEEKIENPAQHKAEEKAKSPVQATPHKSKKKVKSPVQAKSHKVKEKLKSPLQTVPHKVEEKVKGPVHAESHKVEEKLKSPKQTVLH